MRRFDKKKNIQNANLLAEQRYLQSKGLLKENNMLEEPMQQGQSNEDYVKDFLYNFKEMETVIDSDSDTLFAENIKWNLSGIRREASRRYGVVKKSACTRFRSVLLKTRPTACTDIPSLFLYFSAYFL